MANIEKLIACLKHCAGDGDCLQCDRWTLNIEYKCVDDLLLSAAIALEEKQATSNNGKQWIPVTERLPESNRTVLVSVKNTVYGVRHTLMAAHIGHHEAKPEDYGWQEYDGDTQYDEEEDCFWIPECWWESNFVDDNTNWIIDSEYKITHWMPLPEPPKEE